MTTKREKAPQEPETKPLPKGEHLAADYASKTARACEAKGEPVFLLRAQDAHAPHAVFAWANAVSQANPPMADEAREVATEMQAWQREHGAKEPDL